MHWLRQKTIKEVGLEREKKERRKKTKRYSNYTTTTDNYKGVPKEYYAFKRNLKAEGKTHRTIMEDARKEARYIQNDNNKSKESDHDEYYTRYCDVEETCDAFAKHFENKVIFCNCDDCLSDNDEECSAFALYFKKNFKKLKLKKLICLHFDSRVNLFNQDTCGIVYCKDGTTAEIKYYSKNTGFGDEFYNALGFEKEDITNEDLQFFDGTFYHPLSIKILNKVTDIVCTNHPWSLCGKFYEVLLDSNKKFLVISNSRIILKKSYKKTKIVNKDVNLINKIKNKEIRVYKRVENFHQLKDRRTKKKIPVRATGAWFTNLPFERKEYPKEKLLPLKDIPEKYYFVDDNGILCFDNGYIPTDFDKQFAISSAPLINGILEFGYEIVGNKNYLSTHKGKAMFDRILIKKTKN